jgi:apolipoprotein N-acyltransferase
MLAVLITLAALVIFIAIANIMGPLTIAALIISATVSIIIFTTDAFSADINGLFLILPFGILVYGCFYWYKSFMKKRDPDEDEISV